MTAQLPKVIQIAISESQHADGSLSDATLMLLDNGRVYMGQHGDTQGDEEVWGLVELPDECYMKGEAPRLLRAKSG